VGCFSSIFCSLFEEVKNTSNAALFPGLSRVPQAAAQLIVETPACGPSFGAGLHLHRVVACLFSGWRHWCSTDGVSCSDVMHNCCNKNFATLLKDLNGPLFLVPIKRAICGTPKSLDMDSIHGSGVQSLQKPKFSQCVCLQMGLWHHQYTAHQKDGFQKQSVQCRLPDIAEKYAFTTCQTQFAARGVESNADL